MLTIREETRGFIDKVERAAGKKFLFRNDVELLYELASLHLLGSLFEDIIFYAKFVSHASTILKRVGPTNDETAKLADEFKEKLEKVSSLMKTLIDNAPEDMRELFNGRFFSLSQESMNSLMILLQELSRVKNYLLDQERLQT
jgi:hypothetical protein